MEKLSTSIAPNHLVNRASEIMHLPISGDKRAPNGSAANFIGNENQHSDTESLVSESDLLFGFLHPHSTSAKNNISTTAQD